jgi:hypothetical protein
LRAKPGIAVVGAPLASDLEVGPGAVIEVGGRGERQIAFAKLEGGQRDGLAEDGRLHVHQVLGDLLERIESHAGNRASSNIAHRAW